MERKNIWNLYSDEQISELKEINDKYKRCLDAGKTERECVELSVNMARDAGYRDLEEILRSGETLKAGDKVYAVNMNKMLALFRIGERPISEGMNILGAHIDSPRIDVKQNPLYENEELAYLDTHYYGGIKKYQWVAQPLALHGVIVKKNGETVKVSIGEDENDPVFVITDLLVHLAQEQLEKKASQVIEGEKLDLLIGNRPIEKADDLKKEEKDAVKQNVLNILKEMYGIDEEDFYSAELEIVPAGKARDCGLDRSMNLSYGQDDRVCAFTSLFAMLDVTEDEEMIKKAQSYKMRGKPKNDEHRIQSACVRWFRLKYPKLKNVLFAVPNGGRRDAITGARLKEEGATSGVSDLILLKSNRFYGGLCIEMKKPGGRQSPAQKEWQKDAEANGAKYVVCKSLDEFMKVTIDYLNDV